MEKILEVSMDDNMKLYIEAVDIQIFNDSDPLFVPVASNDTVIHKSKNYMESSLAQLRSFADGIANSLKNTSLQPDEFEVEFGVKFAADAGIIISSINTEANITIKMKWNKEK